MWRRLKAEPSYLQCATCVLWVSLFVPRIVRKTVPLSTLVSSHTKSSCIVAHVQTHHCRFIVIFVAPLPSSLCDFSVKNVDNRLLRRESVPHTKMMAKKKVRRWTRQNNPKAFKLYTLRMLNNSVVLAQSLHFI